VGTGPYKFVEWVPNDHITMVKNPDYWDKANEAKVDKIIVKPVPEEGTRIAMLQKGDAQFINFVPYIQADVVKADRNLSLASTEAIYTFWVAMNVQKKPFNDLRVRQALNYAVDKEAVIKAVLRGQGKPADSPLAPRVWGYTPVKTYPYDLAKAKALLAEAGYPNGFKTTLRGAAQTDVKDAMVAIQGQLKQVGVDVEVLAFPVAALTAERFVPLAENKGEMDFAGWSPSTGDADWGIRPLLTKDNWPPSNFTLGYYTNPKVEEAIKAGLQTADAAKRKAAYAEAQRVIIDDCPWIFLWVNNLLGGSRANVGGISIQPDAIGFYRSVYYK
jgi:glutathione transport system substrate-binding protein